ncbi:MAG: hypothetical protein HRT69_14490 [Flavobacteriaceae bacterium]|nr:hypothetical protein [Flavobacteriaceae bacterium]
MKDYISPFSVSIVNRNFLIRYKYDSENKTKLIGAGKYYTLVGDVIENTHFTKVLDGTLDRYTFKLRRGIKIKFVSK